MAADASYERLFSCHGKVAVVTGASGLLGREICKGLRAAGAEVWEADVAEPSGETRYLQVDITSEESVNAALDTVTSTAGRLDIFVNSAYPRTADWGAPLATETFESWKTNVDMHLGGYFLASRASAERMAATGGGSIINVASIYGVVGPSWEIYEGTAMTMPSAYAAIKGGIISLTRHLATHYGPAGVRCNSLSPGGVEDSQAESFRERYAALTPLKRMAHPGDVVGGAIFLCSDAASFVTGHNLVIDGGWTAR